jgi:hypothetical protein
MNLIRHNSIILVYKHVEGRALKHKAGEAPAGSPKRAAHKVAQMHLHGTIRHVQAEVCLQSTPERLCTVLTRPRTLPSTLRWLAACWPQGTKDL